ncbi:MAG: carboxylating nicotinate-nucleotide diphosphorylase [Phycisphaerales bacterium JB039]
MYRALAGRARVRRLAEAALHEDLGPLGRDITSELCVPEQARGRATLSARRPGRLSGLAAAGDVLDVFAPASVLRARKRDGEAIEPGEIIAELSGPSRELLAAERTLLNLLGRLSGIATLTAEYVRAVEGTGAGIYDTRKTTPGLRGLEKYAVRCGGGRLHRIGLYDAVLIKDNHLAHVAPERLGDAVADVARRARALTGEKAVAFVEVEVDSLAQLEQILGIEPGLIDIVLLDNMDVGMLREAVAMRDRSGSGAQLEASGGVTLESIRAIAEAGVERIAIGALTHSAVSLDIGLDFCGPA